MNYFTSFVFRSDSNGFPFGSRTVFVNTFLAVDALTDDTLLEVLIALLSVPPGCTDPARPAYEMAFVFDMHARHRSAS